MAELPHARSMTLVSGIDAIEPAHGPLFVVIGVFDGLHLGHQYLLRQLRRAAARVDARPAVITFDHHPDEILVGAAPPLLCDPAERLQRLSAAGVAVTVVQHFDDALRMTPFDRFVDRIMSRTRLSGFLMTPDAAFGHDRGGTPAALAVLGAERGFDVDVVKPFALDGQPVHSASIRDAIAAATTGTTLAFPLPVALPPPGEYDVRVSPEGRRAVRDRASLTAEMVHLDGHYEGSVRVVFTRPGRSTFAG